MPIIIFAEMPRVFQNVVLGAIRQAGFDKYLDHYLKLMNRQKKVELCEIPTCNVEQGERPCDYIEDTPEYPETTTSSTTSTSTSTTTTTSTIASTSTSTTTSTTTTSTTTTTTTTSSTRTTSRESVRIGYKCEV